MRRAAKIDRFGVDTSNNAYRGAGDKTCEQCGSDFHSYQPKRFCGQKCYHASRVVRQAKPCDHCGGIYVPHVPSRKYCSVACMSAARRPVPKQSVEKKRHMEACQQCGAIFPCPPSTHRKFCSYACHLASGGAKRAGDAAAMAKSKYGAKKDANHKEIFDVLSALTAVKDLSNAGCGVPDGIAWVANGWRLFDVKNPKTGYGKRGLNNRQKQWADDWRGGPVYLIYTIEDAKLFAQGAFHLIKKFPDADASSDRISIEKYRDLHGLIVGNETARRGATQSGLTATPTLTKG